MLNAILVLTGLAVAFGLLLGFAAVRFRVEGDPLVEQLDSILPQTQCGQCGFPGCRPYAEAIASGDAEINLCPPGGEATMVSLAELMGVEPVPLGEGEAPVPSVAWINEEACIGCTLCNQACPVDAIVGAAKQLHTVVATECTGCELCKEPCPVDCISMLPISDSIGTWKWPYPKTAESGQA